MIFDEFVDFENDVNEIKKNKNKIFFFIFFIDLFFG
jgi:hypothetical protein